MDANTNARLRKFGLAVMLSAGYASSASAVDFTVNTNGSAAASPDALAMDYCDTNPAANNQNACTLAAAIQIANEVNNRDKILFQAGLNLITLTTALPSISHPVDIEGNVSGQNPLTAINAANNGLFSFDNAASLNGGSSMVNLKLMNASGTAVRLNGTPYILDNLWIGLNQAGTAAAGSGQNGIVIQNTVSKVPPVLNDLNDLLSALGIGSFGELFTAFGSNPAAFVTAATALLGQDNAIAITNSVISGNGDAGVRIAGGLDGMGNDVLTAGVILAGNRIGTNALGTNAVPNGTGTTGDGSGVTIEINAALNFVIGNVIAANQGQGVSITAGEVDFPNVIGGNFIGLPNPIDVPNPLTLGPSTWGNFESGVFLATLPSAGNAAETAAVVAANFIGFNRCGTWSDPDGLPPFSPDPEDGGIAITSSGGAAESDKTIVVGNLIGVAQFPPSGGAILDLGNLCHGMNVSNGTHIIGGANILDANAIGANDGNGIFLRTSATNGSVIKGNRIGRDYTDSLTFPNDGYGIRMLNSGGNIVGFQAGDAPLFGPNIIASPGASGIRLEGDNAFGNLLSRNRIYGVPAGFIGIELDRDNLSGQDVPDPIDDDDNDVDPLDYANWGQNAPQICSVGGVGACAGAVAPSFSGGNTNLQWSLFSFRNANFRIDFYSISDDDAQWLGEAMVTTHAVSGLGVTGPCNASGLCTSSFASPDTRGTQLVLTATRIDPNIADIPPLEPDPPGNPNDDGPINNTSEYSAPAGIPDEIVFSAADYPVGEAAGDATITLQRLGTGAGAVDITLSLADTSTEAGDHGALSMTAITWPDGDVSNKVVTLPITNDVIDEASEVATLDFTIDAGVAIEGTPSTATVTITDDDAPPVLAITGVDASEGGQLVFTVTRSGNATEQTVGASYAVTPGVGTEVADVAAGVDPLTGTISILPGDSTATISVLAVDDAIFEPAEAVVATLTLPSNAALENTPEDATANIAASDTAPTLSIDDPAQNETDANAPIVFTVTKVGLTELSATANYNTTPGTATTPGDYLAGVDTLSGMLSFAAAETTKTISLVVVGDDLFETPAIENFTVTLSGESNATLAQAVGTATITEDDVAQNGTLAFTSGTFPGNEALASATVTVARSGGTDGVVTVTCNYAAGTATDTEDFSAGNQLLTWGDGIGGNQDCVIPLLPDTVDENNETVNLSLTGPTGGATLSVPDTATLTIADDDSPPVVSITPLSLMQFEGDAGDTPFAFTVTLSAASSFTVDATVQAEESAVVSAVLGVDFDANSQVLQFLPGETSKPFVVMVNGDTADEPDETFEARITAAVNASIDAMDTAVATIQNDDSVTPSFTVSDPAVDETDADGPLLVFTVSRSDAALPASIDVITADGTASGSDYTSIATTTLNFGVGVASLPVNVTVLGDNVFEGNETVLLNLSNNSPGTSIAKAQGVGTITDDETVPTLTLSDVAPTNEGNAATTPFTFVATLSHASTQVVSFTANTGGGDATSGVDYAALSAAPFTIPALSTMTTVTVDVTGETDFETDETFDVTLAGVINAIAGDFSATTTILNDDAAPVNGSLQFSAPTYTVGEAGVIATITVTRTGGSSGPVGVTYGTSDGSATLADNDYTAATGTLSWGDTEVASKTFTVPITNDSTDEPDQTVNLALSLPTGGATLGAPSTAVLTITDDDPPPVNGSLQFSAPTYTVGEAGVIATITVTRTGGSSGPVGVTYGTSDGSATLADNDYTAATGTLSWGDTEVASKTFTVPITNDSADEPDQTVNLALSLPTGGATLGAPSTAVLTITDDDPPPVNGSLQFSAPTYTVGEAGVIATITVTRTGGSSGPVGVTYATSDGSATLADNDYTAATGTLSWGDTEVASKTFTVPITNDSTDEPDQTVNLALSLPTGGATLGAPNTAVLTITDDDLPSVNGSLQFSAATYTVSEAGVTATITVTRTGGSSGDVGLTYATSDGTATLAGNDYTAATGALTWLNSDAAPKTFTVPINNDPTDEPDETVNLTLSLPTGGATLGAPSTAVLTITDDDLPASGVKTFSGTTQTGSGVQNIVFTGGGGTCGFSGGTALVATPQPLPPGGYTFPHGVFASTITNCSIGAVLSFTVTYPQALPAGTVFWKYGRTQSDPSAHWYQYPAVINGAVVTYTLTDGGAGDDDLTANGTIIDPSGPGFAQGISVPATPQLIPALGDYGRWLLLAMIGLLAAFALRQRQ